MSENKEDVFKGLGVPVELPSPDKFLVIIETLERIGIASKKDMTIYQSCHILHKQGKYAIMHFKEMFSLDGRESSLTKEDEQRRNRIARMLEEWGLLKINNPRKLIDDENIFVKIIKANEKTQWKLLPKYSIGVIKSK